MSDFLAQMYSTNHRAKFMRFLLTEGYLSTEESDMPHESTIQIEQHSDNGICEFEGWVPLFHENSFSVPRGSLRTSADVWVEVYNRLPKQDGRFRLVHLSRYATGAWRVFYFDYNYYAQSKQEA